MSQKINIVWLKRDIRSQDHRPLEAAERAGIPYLIIYIFEPSLINYPDTSTRHLQFIHHSIKDLNATLKPHNGTVTVFHCEAREAFEFLLQKYAVQNVFSYEEHGIRQSWNRDGVIREQLAAGNIEWTEFKKNGVIRGSKNRDGWDKQWYVTMNEPLIKNQYTDLLLGEIEHPYPLQPELEQRIKDYPIEFQPAGETFAWKYLHSFTDERGKNYHRFISKPELSRTSCGRISPYLAWGNISIKQAVHHIKFHENYKDNKRAFQGILTRLKWHCHFIQKFEVECDYETRCVNRGYELLVRKKNEEFIKAWKIGMTGFPMVDACMRCLKETGWINFRMRAMVVSLLCHHLDQDWREGVYHLARLFLDYEPGIHYPQFQMQAGTTGVNTVRMYNPVKQSADHDPDGVFIRKWVPELREIPIEYLHEPWKMTEMDKSFNNIEFTYPHPIVDLTASGKAARAKIWGHRKNEKVKAERKRIIETHTRNK
ncbi:MAG: deoxyribodipyrimidine photo-lyase [Bacteroidota bacterium]